MAGLAWADAVAEIDDEMLFEVIDGEIQERKCHNIITKVLDELIPLEPTKIAPSWQNWWTEELQKMKNKLRKDYRLVKSRFCNQYIINSYT